MRVLTTSATRNSGLAIVRALGRMGIEVIGADDRPTPLGLRSRYSRPYGVYPPAGDPLFTDGMFALLERTRPDVFLPSATWIVRRVTWDAERFREVAGVLVPSRESFDAVFDRTAKARLCAEAGVPAPALFDRDRAARYLEQSRGEERIVVKPSYDWGGARGVTYCRDPDELDRALVMCREQYDGAIIQEYVPGGSDAMRTLTVVYDRHSELLAWFTTKKLRQWPVHGGVTASCISTREERLLDLVRPLFSRLAWRGPAEVEFKIDARDGTPKLIEVNPRLPGYIGFSVACGINLPWIACMAAAGRENEVKRVPGYTAGRRYVSASPYFRSLRAELAAGGRSRVLLRELAATIRPGVAGNCRDWTDPAPRLAKLLLEVRRRIAGDPAGAEHTRQA